MSYITVLVWESVVACKGRTNSDRRLGYGLPAPLRVDRIMKSVIPSIGLAVIAWALVATVAAAQGTGSRGCYFDACDDEVKEERDRFVEDQPNRDTQNNNSGQLMCMTPYGGSCVMVDQNYPVGQFCNCPGPLGITRIDGFTQRVGANSESSFQPPQPRVAAYCVTQMGSCQLYSRGAVGMRCYCQSIYGPIPGISQ